MTLTNKRSKTDIRYFIKSWWFWPIIAIAILASISEYLKLPFLSYPFTFMVLGFIPGMVGKAWSNAIAKLFVRSLKGQHWLERLIWSKNKKDDYLYLKTPQYVEDKPSILMPVFWTLVHVFGMIYLTQSITHELVPTAKTSFESVFALSFLALVVSSGFNIAAWLLRMNGYIFEQKAEGERRRIGNILSERMGIFFGITVLLSFAYDIYKNSDYSVLSASLFVIILYTPSLIFSYKILEKRQLLILRKELDKKLERYVKME